MEDAHLLEMAQRNTDKKQLQHLGLNILKVSADKVASALYNEKDIQDAALEVLKTWYKIARKVDKKLTGTCTDN